MAKRVEEAAFHFQDLLLLAVKEEKEKRAVLDKASYELERLKISLRLCRDLNLLSIRQYEHSSRQVVEIGRLLGGWLKKA
jgi:hypothetical protein